MGVFTHEMDVISPIPPAKVFKSFVLEFDTLFPKVIPHAIKSVEVLEGNGGPGTIKKVTFAEGVVRKAGSGFDYMKHKVEELDKDNLTYTYSVIEGELLKNVLEKITYETKLAEAPNGGTNVKVTTKFYTIGDFQMTEDLIKDAVEMRAQAFMAVQEYLLANPNV